MSIFPKILNDGLTLQAQGKSYSKRTFNSVLTKSLSKNVSDFNAEDINVFHLSCNFKKFVCLL